MKDQVIVTIKIGQNKETILRNGKRRIFDTQEEAEKAIIEHARVNFNKLDSIKKDTEGEFLKDIVEYKIIKRDELIAQLK